MFIHLSHIIDPEDGAFPGEPTAKVHEDSVHSDTQPFNSYMIDLPNHCGTHMDGPRHFNSHGTNFSELGIEKFAFMGDEIVVIDLPEMNKEGAIVNKAAVEPFADQIKGKRLLIIRTGFEEHKKGNPDLYENRGPALHPDLCEWLNKDFPELDSIGMDWLSVASPLYDFGPEAHHWLLGNYTGHTITAIEDMSLKELGDKKIKVLTMGPLRIKDVDSAPVNIMALVE